MALQPIGFTGRSDRAELWVLLLHMIGWCHQSGKMLETMLQYACITSHLQLLVANASALVSRVAIYAVCTRLLRSRDGNIKLWRVEANELIGLLDSLQFRNNCVALSALAVLRSTTTRLCPLLQAGPAPVFNRAFP